MPTFNVIGQVFFAAGLDELVDAASEEEAERIVIERVRGNCDAWLAEADVQEVCVSTVMEVK